MYVIQSNPTSVGAPLIRKRRWNNTDRPSCTCTFKRPATANSGRGRVDCRHCETQTLLNNWLWRFINAPTAFVCEVRATVSARVRPGANCRAAVVAASGHVRLSVTWTPCSGRWFDVVLVVCRNSWWRSAQRGRGRVQGIRRSSSQRSRRTDPGYHRYRSRSWSSAATTSGKHWYCNITSNYSATVCQHCSQCVHGHHKLLICSSICNNNKFFADSIHTL